MEQICSKFAFILILEMHNAEAHSLMTGHQPPAPSYPFVSTLTLLQTTFCRNSQGGFSGALDNVLRSVFWSDILTKALHHHLCCQCLLSKKCPCQGLNTLRFQSNAGFNVEVNTLSFSLSFPCIVSLGLRVERLHLYYREYLKITIFAASGSVFLISDFKEVSQISGTSQKPL